MAAELLQMWTGCSVSLLLGPRQNHQEGNAELINGPLLRSTESKPKILSSVVCTL